MITLLSIVALGFLLGMRHATDPDHVIAVTTIVSRQRSIRHAALIGFLWGVGHRRSRFLLWAHFVFLDALVQRFDFYEQRLQNLAQLRGPKWFLLQREIS